MAVLLVCVSHSIEIFKILLTNPSKKENFLLILVILASSNSLVRLLENSFLNLTIDRSFFEQLIASILNKKNYLLGQDYPF